MKLYENGSYCIYLRKSRADREAEQRGEGETLARHEKILLDLAKRSHITIGAIYREVVSGETIAARPMMQQLLREVENGIWDGVLVVEVERLARGDTIDQGTVSRAFQFSDTLIITPMKIYDPNNEFDEEYFEFGLFMSRREYKTIKRRLNAGRVSSVQEGKYVGNIPPYGYTRVKIPHDKGYTLSPLPEQASVVQLIFDLYVHGKSGDRIGVSKIVRHLNTLGIPPAKGDVWVPASVQTILSNPVYIGMVRWNARKTVSRIVDGKVIKQRPRSKDYTLSKGLHPAIVDKTIFDAAQAIRAKNPARPVNTLNKIKNPLSGIVRCSGCGRIMVRRPYTKTGQGDTLMCSNTACQTISSKLSLVEQAVLDGIQELLQHYKLNDSIFDSGDEYTIDSKEQLLESQKNELQKLSDQKLRLYDFLEQGIYSTEIFLQRSEDLRERIARCSDSIDRLADEITYDRKLLSQRINFIPKCENLLSHYWELDIPTRNEVLKELLDKVVYTKDVRNTRRNPEDISFHLEIYPKLL